LGGEEREGVGINMKYDYLGCLNTETNQGILKIQMIIKGF